METDFLGSNPSTLSSESEGGAAAPHAYFSTPALLGIIQQLNHLAFFGDGVTVVEGVAGSGKTSLTAELSRKLEKADYFTCLSFESGADLGGAIAGVAGAFGLESNSELSVGELISELRHFTQSLSQDKKLAILLIDDAHHLDDQAVGALTSLLQGGDGASFGMKLVFFTLPGFSKRVDDLHILDVPVYDFEMPSMSPSELAGYLAIVRPDVNLSAERVQKIWVRSKGTPGLSVKVLEEDEREREATKFTFSSLPFGHIAALSVLVLILVWAVVGGNDSEPLDVVTPITGKGLGAEGIAKSASNEAGSEVSEQDPEEAAAASSEANSSLITAVATEQASFPSAVPERPLVAADGAAVSVSLEKEEVAGGDKSSFVSSTADITKPRLELPTTVVPGGTGLKATNAQDEEEKKPVAGDSSGVVVAANTASSGVEALTQQESFLLSRSPEHYTLQVIAASKKASIERYIALQSNRENLLMYRGERESKRWYVVVEGVYSSRAAAMAAVQTLPSNQVKAGPWPRKLRSIQEEIKEIRD